jgi:outer membrane murein-binding lipoprotein Lpp
MWQQQRHRFLVQIAAALTVLALSGPVSAAEILEMGNNYHIIAYEACMGEAGVVAMRIDVMAPTSTSSKINNRIEFVQTEPGWSYNVVKAGGLSSAIEIDFQNDSCTCRFKSLYKPGKTTVDSGSPVCK